MDEGWVAGPIVQLFFTPPTLRPPKLHVGAHHALSDAHHSPKQHTCENAFSDTHHARSYAQHALSDAHHALSCATTHLRERRVKQHYIGARSLGFD